MDKIKLKRYEEMRREIDLIKEKDNFKCQKCGLCCSGLFDLLSDLDLEYMKEKEVDLTGITVDSCNIRLKTIDCQCYYYNKKTKKCKIHPYNPMLCHTYPFVANIDTNEFYFKYCVRERERRKDLVTDEMRTLLGKLLHLSLSE